MKFAIGTERAPKIQGIQEGIALCSYFDSDRDAIELICKSVPSDISDMPLSIEEVILGAKNRAENLRKAGIEADYYVGIEGGCTRINDKAYLFGSVGIMNAAGEFHVGFSPMVEVPTEVDRLLYVEGKDLGPVMAELSGKLDIRSQEGSMGAWTDGMLTRANEFSEAFRAAIAPFYNEYYRL